MQVAERLTQLVNDYQTPLRRMCFLVLHDVSLAEDAVQETFLRACRSLPSFRGECSEKSWLMRIAINVCRDLQRSRWRRHIDSRVQVEDIPLSSPCVDVETLALHEAIRRLPPKLRDAVLLYYYQNMTLREAADALHATPSTVSKRLDKARSLLRAALERSDSDA